ncbi:molybdopterin cofactor-binding domain-containing protein [Tardiphaga sp.]|uniref:xanthine dehydrogenase family protein molybdopterin-binding subunit n=1 Tax=Tardiphaga sp. TaxID=1926292 RepID=UPI00352A664F
MSRSQNRGTTRRDFLVSAGILVASFSLSRPTAMAQIVEGAAPISFAKTKRLDGWIRISADNVVTIFTGKAELGQGILTALAQIAAEELDVGVEMIRVISADTSRGPDEGYTYGSQSIEQSGSALRIASAQARAVFVAAASSYWSIDARAITIDKGVIVAADGRRITYGALAAQDKDLLSRDVTSSIRPKSTDEYRIVGRSTARIDLPDKILAKGVFLQDMRQPGMVFGRVIRPPTPGAKLVGFDPSAVRAMPGVLSVVHIGSFLGVVAEREEQAIRASDAVRANARWEGGEKLPNENELAAELLRFAKEDLIVAQTGRTTQTAPIAHWVEATYTRPYLSQGSIGPSCAVARFSAGRLTVWSHTQGAFPLRADLAKVVGLPVNLVDVVHVQASGCYGHNGADDAALDAALLALSVEGRPVKLQWMRDDEFAWSPISPAMVMSAKAGLSAEGRIVDWSYDVWSNTHATRPGQPGGTNLLAAWYLNKGYTVSPPLHIPQPFGNGDRNAVPCYDLPRVNIAHHVLTAMPIRTGSLRTLGGHSNILAIECFMDELAAVAGEDPIAFRLKHLTDVRAKAVVEAVRSATGWPVDRKRDGKTGRGFAYARYKNISTYAAVAVEVELDRTTCNVTVKKVHAAVDVGRVINPDGVKSQSEGGIVQGISWAMKERMRFSQHKITSTDWSTYPIITFDEIPQIDVVVLDRPKEPSLGAGEGTIGPASAAFMNAVADAVGRPIRDLPITSERIRDALRI